MERRKGKAINIYEAQRMLQELVEDSVMTRKRGHRPEIKYLLNIREQVILVVNMNSKVIITMYGVLK